MIDQAEYERSPWHVLLVFLRLGLTSFGGPAAHLAYFRDEFVARRRWLSEHGYADLVALCQFLPGPASSQVGIAIGLGRAGYAGALAAWAGFTLPSALAMTLCALGMVRYGALAPAGALHGLKVVAVAVVAQAVWGMGRHFCRTPARVAIAALAAGATLLAPFVWMQVGAMAAAAIVGLLLFKPEPGGAYELQPASHGRRAGAVWLALLLVLLLALPLFAQLLPGPTAQMAAAFFRVGALVFGGGHVVLPLLQAEVVPNGWVGNDVFLAGYGAAQAMPGPLFSFAAFLGAAMRTAPSGWLGALVCLLAIFAPSFLLVAGVLPFWDALRRSARTRAALAGVNAAVVGLLLAALYHPVWTSAIYRPLDVLLALLALAALMVWKLPPWLVVMGGGAAGVLLSMLT